MQFPSSEPRVLNRIDNLDFPWRAFPQPLIIGEYSVDGAREVVFDRSQLQIFKPVSAQRVRFNLNDGLRERVPKMEKFEGLDNMLKWILHTRQQTKEDLKSDFVCYRGALSTLMKTPYEQEEGWIIKVVKFNGTVYMMQVDTEEQSGRRMQQQESERDQKFTAWGYKFEQFMSVQVIVHDFFFNCQD
ncbi:decapping and exoribonuclease protein [Eurytemora carolleeae]|uniref:decapping and exoribonuclease protein n=1 Tax=Eurytemora carolleeae TaxID=1294199 RepID=UPI000C759450|nr:decapping and exoribonuclease protein [Eurytemora carolleeae]|eukprot:XP_023338931.1 decapping and exoribonuclease protein-like [Eurytemora affinis]